MPCEICKNQSFRNYTHSKGKHHRKLLLKRMKQIKEENTDRYGLFFYPDLPSEDNGIDYSI